MKTSALGEMLTLVDLGAHKHWSACVVLVLAAIPDGGWWC